MRQSNTGGARDVPSPGSREPSPAVSAVPASIPRAETWLTISDWCDETFGPAMPFRIATRANEEMAELLLDCQGSHWTEAMKIEAADVIIVLARIPGIWDAVERKMEINRARKWRLTGDGCGYHIPAQATEGNAA